MNATKILSCSRGGTFTNVLLRNYAFKSDLKIKWVRPEPIPCYKPQKSGDMEPMKKQDLNDIVPEFRKSKELQDADEVVRKLFTLEFAPRKFSSKAYVEDMVEKVKRHNYDIGSAQVKIARMTGAVRANQDVMEKFPRNKKLKVRLQELIDKRNKQLKYLRKWDYKRFEWLIETLNIVYKPRPILDEKPTRKESLRKLTKLHCDGIREEQLTKYRLQLENEQPTFLEEKMRALQFIRNEQKECGVEVTVTDEEIEAIKKQIEELKKKIELIED